jgi:hypothetical protein
MKTWLQWLFEHVREIAPYLAMELILPGGTLIVLALWLYRRRAALTRPVSRRDERARQYAAVFSRLVARAKEIQVLKQDPLQHQPREVVGGPLPETRKTASGRFATVADRPEADIWIGCESLSRIVWPPPIDESGRAWRCQETR